MTQYIEPNRKSDLTQATVRAWLSPMSSGILDGFEVTPGTSGFLINIASGRVVNRGTVIHDDLTRLNLSLIAHSAGSNEHHIVYASYTPAETFPPPAMVISVVTSSAASPSKPVSPNMPADSVKLADIFISGSATTWGSGTQIINAPKVAARGIDVTQTEVIADRLIQANANVMVSGGGGFTYSGGTLTWDQAIVITSSTVTSRESYFTAPIARLTVAAGSLAGVGANSLLFVVFDRRVPGAATTQPLRVLDLDNPDPVQRDLFFNANTRDQIVVIGAMTSGALSLRGGMGMTLPPSASEPPPRVLHNVPGGQPVWAPVDDTDLVGGMRVVADVAARTAIPSAQRKIGMIVLTQSDGAANVLTALPDTWSPLLTASGAIDNIDDSKIIGGLHVVADTAARDAIVSGKRKEGMVVYSQADDRHFVLEGGVTNSNWKELGDDSRLVGGLRVIDWDSTANPNTTTFLNAQIPAANRKIGMIVRMRDTVVSGNVLEKVYVGSNVWADNVASIADLGFQGTFNVVNSDSSTIQIYGSAAGQPVTFFTPTGKKITTPAWTSPALTDGTFIVYWDDSDSSFKANLAQSTGIQDVNDLAIGVVVRASGTVTRFRVFAPKARGSRFAEIIIGASANNPHFTSIADAMAWRCQYALTNTGLTKNFRVIGDVNAHSNTSLGLVDVSALGVVTADATNTTSRFKRDLAVGDVVQIVQAGSGVNAKVASIASDTQFTITDYLGAAWTTASTDSTLYRHDDASSYTKTVDMAMAEFGSFAGRLPGSVVYGVGEADNSSKPSVVWGGVEGDGTGVYAATKPMFNLSGLANFTVSNLLFSYSGRYEGGNWNVCWMKDPGKGFLVDGVSVDGGGASECLSCVFNLGFDIGGDFADTAGESAPLVRRSSFIDLHKTMTSHIYVSSSSVDGTLKFEDCRFSVANVTFTDTGFFLFSTAAHNLDVIIDSCRVANIRCALFADASLPPNSVKRVDNCFFGVSAESEGSATKLAVSTTTTGTLVNSGAVATLVGSATDPSLMIVGGLSGMSANSVGNMLTISGASGAGNNGTFVIVKFVSANQVQVYNPARQNTADASNGSISYSQFESPDVERASMSNCEFIDEFDYMGASEIVACRSTSEVTLNNVGSFIATRFKSTILNRVTTSRRRFIPADAAASVEIGRSQIVSGMETYPDYEVSGAPNNWHVKAEIKVSAGFMVLPNGLIARFISDTNRNLSPGAGAGTLLNSINGALPTFGGAVDHIYVFARMKAGESTPTIEYDLSPPDEKGRPAATTQAGYNVNDYGYLGMFYVREFYVNNTGVGSPDPDEATQPLWRQCTVQYLGNGLRMVTVGDPEDEDTAIGWSDNTPASASTSNASMSMAGLSSSGSRLFTAKFYQFTLSTRVETDASIAGFSAYLFATGMINYHSLAASQNSVVSVSGWLPVVTGGEYYSGYRPTFSAGVVTISSSRRTIGAIIEDVNRIGMPAGIADTRFPF